MDIVSNILARSPEPSEHDKVIDFLNKNLRLNITWTIKKEYPIALSSHNLHNLSIITDETESKILSHALLKPFVCKTAQAIFKIGAIGSVVTEPESRHQGLSKKNILNCIKKSQDQDCDLVILWSDQHDFYKKFGFELAGFEYSYLISQALPVVNKNYKFLKSNKIDSQAILKLYNQHTVNSLRTVDEIQHYLNIPNSNIFTLWNLQNQIVAYAVEGKGVDLQTYIHEWGGSVPDIMDLLSHMIQTEKIAYTFICPDHSLNIRSKLETICDVSNTGFLGLIKINDFEKFSLKIKKMFLAEGITEITIEKKDDQIIFGYKSDLYTIKNETNFIRLVFGPQKFRDLGFVSESTTVVFEKIFPLPLWVWGWDSV